MRRLARLATEVLAPWVWVLALPSPWPRMPPGRSGRPCCGDHSRPEVLVGALMGVVVGGGSYWLLEMLLR